MLWILTIRTVQVTVLKREKQKDCSVDGCEYHDARLLSQSMGGQDDDAMNG